MAIVLLEQVVVQKRFLKYAYNFCVLRCNPESQRGMVSGTRNSRGFDWESGSLQSCSLFQDRTILLHLTRNLHCSVNPELGSTIGSQSQASSLDASTIHQFLRVSFSICFFATNSSQFFNFLAISCMIFLGESILHFLFSIQAYFCLF